jgi:hypothetical protein
MIAHRQIHNVKGNQLTIDIPPEINTDNVEIIILALDDSNIESFPSTKNREVSSDLSSNTSTLIKEEVKKWKKIIKRSGKWKTHKKYFERLEEIIKHKI